MAAALKSGGIDPKTVVENAARAFFNQVFRDGFFHADLHPGNLFVLEDGAIGAVDFMVKRSPKSREEMDAYALESLSRAKQRKTSWLPLNATKCELKTC